MRPCLAQPFPSQPPSHPRRCPYFYNVILYHCGHGTSLISIFSKLLVKRKGSASPMPLGPCLRLVVFCMFGSFPIFLRTSLLARSCQDVSFLVFTSLLVIRVGNIVISRLRPCRGTLVVGSLGLCCLVLLFLSARCVLARWFLDLSFLAYFFIWQL